MTTQLEELRALARELTAKHREVVPLARKLDDAIDAMALSAAMARDPSPFGIDPELTETFSELHVYVAATTELLDWHRRILMLSLLLLEPSSPEWRRTKDAAAAGTREGHRACPCRKCTARQTEASAATQAVLERTRGKP